MDLAGGQSCDVATAPELASLIYVCVKNNAGEVLASLNVPSPRNTNPLMFTALTSFLCTKKAFYAQDKERISIEGPNELYKETHISIDEKELRASIGKRQEREVSFSDDKKTRYTPNTFKRGLMSTSDLEKNAGIATIFSGYERASLMAKAIDHLELEPFFYVGEKYPLTGIIELFTEPYENRFRIRAGAFVNTSFRIAYGCFRRQQN